jgi:hypothetical protein
VNSFEMLSSDRRPSWLPKSPIACGPKVLTGTPEGHRPSSFAPNERRIEGMTVVDASVFVDALVSIGPSGDMARQELRGRAVLEVPSIFGAEVTVWLARTRRPR